MTFQQILNGDSGLNVRARLNSMLSSLIEGEQGVNAVWAFLRTLDAANKELAAKENADVTTLEEGIAGANTYTDTSINRLYTYVDGMSGGVGGLIDSTSYDPSSLPTDKAITLIALGAGTFTNLKDITDTAITISSPNAITVFYRSPNVTYWNYKSIIVDAPVVDSTPTQGNTDHVVSSAGLYTSLAGKADIDSQSIEGIVASGDEDNEVEGVAISIDGKSGSGYLSSADVIILGSVSSVPTNSPAEKIPTWAGILNRFGGSYTYKGVATLSTTPDISAPEIFYLLGEAGVYTSMGNIQHESGIGIARWNGVTWSYENVPTSAILTPESTDGGHYYS